MATPVEMPKLGNTVEECLLAKWKKNVGDPVSSGEIVADIETDKATFELAAPVDGTLLATFFEEGVLIPVFAIVCVIGSPGESVEQFRPAAAAPQAPQTVPGASAPPASAARQSFEPAPATASLPAAEIAFSPRARRYARDHGFSLPAIRGSGPGGRVIEQDLRDLYASSPKVSSLARKHLEAGYEAHREGSGIGGMIVARDLDAPPTRMSGIRAKTAQRMRESLAGSAQYTMNASADATGMLALRAILKATRLSRDVPDVNINEMVMFCTVKALLDRPELNADIIDGKIYKKAAIHLGFACDTDKGLLVPVIRDCQKLTLAELSAKTKELTRQVTEGSIGMDDLSGATFTVSNLGNLGVESFTPILNPPQVALLGVDTIELKPVRRNGAVEFVDHIGLSLTCDHQVIDGAPGARFLQVLKDKIEKIGSISDLKL
jgi:pyruvate dehydrogenase E2 component (dihydrolipoamide acetyltransferase)